MIAIKSMKNIPKSCEVCDFRKSDPYSGEVYCSKAIGSNTIIYEKERLDNCPLVEIITCKDCKYNCENSCDYDGWGVNDDYFCAKGERREQCQE